MRAGRAGPCSATSIGCAGPRHERELSGRLPVDVTAAAPRRSRRSACPARARQVAVQRGDVRLARPRAALARRRRAARPRRAPGKRRDRRPGQLDRSGRADRRGSTSPRVRSAAIAATCADIGSRSPGSATTGQRRAIARACRALLRAPPAVVPMPPSASTRSAASSSCARSRPSAAIVAVRRTAGIGDHADHELGAFALRAAACARRASTSGRRPSSVSSASGGASAARTAPRRARADPRRASAAASAGPSCATARCCCGSGHSPPHAASAIHDRRAVHAGYSATDAAGLLPHREHLRRVAVRVELVRRLALADRA